MRLIDADKLDVVVFEMKDTSDQYRKGFCDGVLKLAEVIDSAPTIDIDKLPKIRKLKKSLRKLRKAEMDIKTSY